MNSEDKGRLIQLGKAIREEAKLVKLYEDYINSGNPDYNMEMLRKTKALCSETIERYRKEMEEIRSVQRVRRSR